MEVLAALQHAQHCIGREFTKDEFLQGTVGQHMIPEDFRPEEMVSTMSAYSPDHRPRQEIGFVRIRVSSIHKNRLLIHQFKNTSEHHEFTAATDFPRGFITHLKLAPFPNSN